MNSINSNFLWRAEGSAWRADLKDRACLVKKKLEKHSFQGVHDGCCAQNATLKQQNWMQVMLRAHQTKVQVLILAGKSHFQSKPQNVN